MNGANVVLLTPVFPPARGGIETMCKELVRNSCHQWRVVTLAEPNVTPADNWGAVSVRRARNDPRGGRRSIARLTVAAAGETECDVVVCMHVRCVPAAAIIKARTGARWLQYFHAKEVPTYPRQARFAARRADGLVAVSSYTADLVRGVAGHTKAPVQCMPPGTTSTADSARLRGGPPTVITVSRLNDYYKGHDVILEALVEVRRRVPDVRWRVIGDGRLRPSLEQKCRDLGLTANVTFLGEVDDATRDAELNAAHVFAMPSRVPPDGRGGDGFGIAYLEAASRRLAVVAGDEGGVVDAVVADVTGLLVPPRDSSAVAHALIELLTDPERARTMGDEGRTFAQSLSWDRVVKRADEVIAALAHGPDTTSGIARR